MHPRLALLAVTLFAPCALVAASCSSPTARPRPACEYTNVPPAPVDAGPDDAGGPVVFALRNFVYGERTGADGGIEFVDVGYDLDRPDDAGNCTATCRYVQNRADGTDNNIGNVMERIRFLNGVVYSDEVNGAVQGGATWLLRLDGLPSGASGGPVHATLLRGVRTEAPHWVCARPLDDGAARRQRDAHPEGAHHAGRDMAVTLVAAAART